MKQIYLYMKAGIVLAGASMLLLSTIITVFGQETSNKSTIQDTVSGLATRRPAVWNIISSISTVSGENINKHASYSPGNALYGLLPGLSVLQRSGEPGYNDPDLRIRGNGTFGNSNVPLVLVDGFEHELNSVAIDDIASISVLKDAASAVHYGGRAANGVILVTTKRGSKGKPVISVNLLQGIQHPMGLPGFVNSADYATMYNEALENDGLPILFTQQQIQAYRSEDPVYYPNVDWVNELVRDNAPASRANVNASGGNDVVQYYASAGYLAEDGIYDHTEMHKGYSTNDKLKSITFRSNLDIRIVKDWKLKFDMYGQINDKNAPYQSTANIWNALYKYSSTIPVYSKSGLLGGTATFPVNPMGMINEQGYRSTHERYLIANLATEYDLGRVIKGLVAGVRFGYDNFYSVSDAWTKTFESYAVLGKDATTGGPILSAPYGKNTSLSYISPSGDNQSLRYNLEGFLNYRAQINEYNDLYFRFLYHQDKLTLGPESPYYTQSFSGTLNYNLRDRYLVELGLCYSGSEAFKKGNRFTAFPVISAGWILSDESFMKGFKQINFLKLWASAGVVGRSNVGLRFAYRDFYNNTGSYFFGTSTTAVGGLAENDLSNPELTFERSNKYEIGMESVLFKDISIAVSYYYQRRTNILVSQDNLIPSMIGIGLMDANEGKAEGRGLDLSFNVCKAFKNWGYFAGLNYSLMKSKILFNAELPVPDGSEYNYRTGQPISQPYGLEFIGFFGSESEIENSPDQQFGSVRPGDMKYRDRNNDGFINGYDEGPIANSSLPQSEIGLSLGLNYRNFDVQGILQAQLGRDVYMGSAPVIFWPLINDAKISTFVNNPWTAEDHESAGYPRLTTTSNPNNYRSSTFWYRKADFLRLRSVEIGYNFPLSATSKIGADKIRIFLRGMNLLTGSSFSYVDPETIGGYPAMKSYNLGLNVQF